MKIYNTLSRRKEALVSLRDGCVTMYSCGLTVYRYIHIGNLRAFTTADWLRRTLVRQGLIVHHIKNVTDVGNLRVDRPDHGEDKLVAQARRESRSAREIATIYTAAFHRDERRLNILPAHEYPHASSHIAEMIALIQRLEARGLAYSVGGNVYFDVSRFKGMASCRETSSTASSPASTIRWTTRNAIVAISGYGKRPSQAAKWPGRVPGASATPAGILNVAPWQRATWASGSTYIPAAWISSFLTRERAGPKRRRARASLGFGLGTRPALAYRRP